VEGRPPGGSYDFEKIDKRRGGVVMSQFWRIAFLPEGMAKGETIDAVKQTGGELRRQAVG